MRGITKRKNQRKKLEGIGIKGKKEQIGYEPDTHTHINRKSI